MESLHIRRENQDDDRQANLPLLFGGKMPSLRYLSLNNVRKLGGNKFKNLVYLHLSNQCFEARRAAGAGVPDVLAILRASPQLESCIFKKCACDVENPNTQNFGLPMVRPGNANRIALTAIKRLVLDACSAPFTVHIVHRVVLTDPLALFISCA